MLQPFYDSDSGNYGFRNDLGQVVIPPLYDRVEEFSNGVAVVTLDEQEGLIDQEGQVILPCAYDSILTFRTGWVQAQKKEVSYLYTARGAEVLQLTCVLKWHPPYEGLIRVKKGTGWGAVNLQGETVIPFQYISLGPCCNGWLSFFESGRWGWLDRQGRVAVPAVFSEVGEWDSRSWWGRSGDGYTLYDYDGKVVRREGWQKILWPRSSGEAAVKTAAGWKFMDADLNTVLQLPPVYEWVEHFSEGLAAVKRNGLWGFMDAQGQEVIQPVYQKVSLFSEGLASVQSGGLWGFIDTTGKLVIPCLYPDTGSFRGGKAWVRDSWCEWYINHQGEDVSERKYWD